MQLNKKDWLILFSFVLITISPIILGLSSWGQRNYFTLVFFAGFIPVITTHTTPVGLKFRNITFSCIWILIIALNGILYYHVAHLWLSLIVSFLFFNLLRLIFKAINRESPIPLFISVGMSLDYNTGERRMENKRDLLFSMTSFFLGLFLSLYSLLLTR